MILKIIFFQFPDVLLVRSDNLVFDGLEQAERSRPWEWLSVLNTKCQMCFTQQINYSELKWKFVDLSWLENMSFLVMNRFSGLQTSSFESNTSWLCVSNSETFPRSFVNHCTDSKNLNSHPNFSAIVWNNYYFAGFFKEESWHSKLFG